MYSDDLIFGRQEGKLEAFAKICITRNSGKICVAASLETLRKDPSIHALQKSTTRGCLEATKQNL